MNLNSTTPPEPSASGTPTPRVGAPVRSRVAPTVLVVAIVIIASAAVGAVALLHALTPPAPAPAGSVSVQDDAGRQVSLSKVPSRIVALDPSVVDLLVRLGLRGSLVGIDCGTASAGGVLADYTPAQVANWSLTGVTCLTWFPALDLEAILAVHPDLVIGGAGIKVSDLNTLTESDDVPTLYLNPSTILGIEYDSTILGHLARRDASASALDASMSATLGALAALTSNASEVPSVPTVLLTYYDDPTGYYTFGPGTFGNDLVTLVAGASISASDVYANQQELSGSYVLAANPSVIVVGTGFGLSFQNYSVGPDWSSLSAVQSAHVYPIDATLVSEPDPTMIFGLGQLFQALHPGVPFPSQGS